MVPDPPEDRLFVHRFGRVFRGGYEVELSGDGVQKLRRLQAVRYRLLGPRINVVGLCGESLPSWFRDEESHLA